MLLLMVTSEFGLGRRHWSSQRSYLHRAYTLYMHQILLKYFFKSLWKPNMISSNKAMGEFKFHKVKGITKFCAVQIQTKLGFKLVIYPQFRLKYLLSLGLAKDLHSGLKPHLIICPCSRQITTPLPHHPVFTGWMPFLPPNQQHQSTESQLVNAS